MPQTISRGKTGPVVRELQQNLRRRGAVLKPDALFGAETEKAVRAFQKSVHLHPDGIVGARTWNALHGADQNARRVPEPPIHHDSMFEQMLKDAGAWLEEHNPFALRGAGASTATVLRAARAPGRLPGPEPRGAPATARAAPQTAKSPTVVVGTSGTRTNRIGFDGYEGRGWVVKDFAELRDAQVREFRNGTFAVNPAGGKRWGKNECAHLVKYFGVPYTGTWRRGPQVCHFKPGELPIGTVIATLRDNSYHSDYSGRSHVGIYLGHDDYAEYVASNSKTSGLRMWNQSNGKLVHESKFPYGVDANAYGGEAKEAWKRDGKWTKSKLSWTKDGEEYFVVMTK